MSSLVKCRELFEESSFPIAATNVESRPLVQTDFHRHEFFEMIFVSRGSLLNRLPNEEMLLKPGDLLILKPFAQHLLAGRPGKHPGTAYCCSFLPQIVDSSILSIEDARVSRSPNKHFFKPFLSLAADNVLAVVVPVPPKRRSATVKLFQRLQKAAHGRTDADFARARCHFLELLASLADGFEENQGSNQPAQKIFNVAKSRYHKGLRIALNHIHDHFAKQLTLGDMAALSGVSVSYFSMLMKHSTGTSFLNYLTGLRIDQACALLRDSSDNITDICYRVGFNDYSHFSRKFKAVIGRTPREYRKESQPA